jgi:hypothetical protein
MESSHLAVFSGRVRSSERYLPQHDITTGNRGFAVRSVRMEKSEKRTAKPLGHTTPFCTVKELCRAHFIKTHDNPLLCANVDARQTVFKTY